jgi:hypothetical protein
LVKYITFSISIAFISWIVGMVLNELIKKKPFYSHLSTLNFIKNEKFNQYIGLEFFKSIVKNTFFKYFNQKLKLKNKVSSLSKLRNEMTFSEISHLIGFGFVTIFALIEFTNGNYLFGLIIMIVNLFMNLYPSLLQQKNKRRIDKLIRKQ